jgi:hypothetical protein
VEDYLADPGPPRIPSTGLLALAEEPEGEAPAPEDDDLRKKVQNPIADMISVPIETTVDFGADNGSAYFINLQPVIPVKIGDVLLVNRTIVPLLGSPGGIPGRPGNPEPADGGREFGLGDINHSIFWVPSKSSDVTWGFGPILSFPTATSEVLGSGKWSAGITGVVLTQPKPWSLGILIGNVWSYAGDSDRDEVNQMFLQPFVNYNLEGGWFLTSSPMVTANWYAESGDRWKVPLGGGAGRVFTIGKQPMNVRLQFFYNVVRPDGGPDWEIQLTIQFLFPK